MYNVFASDIMSSYQGYSDLLSLFTIMYSSFYIFVMMSMKPLSSQSRCYSGKSLLTEAKLCLYGRLKKNLLNP